MSASASGSGGPATPRLTAQLVAPKASGAGRHPNCLTYALAFVSLASLVLGASSCGRTELISSGEVGTGASGGPGDAGAAGGSDGAGATGGATPCAGIERRLPIIDVEHKSGEPDAITALIPSTDDGQGITVVIRSAPWDSSERKLRLVSFSPWLAWPETDVLGPTQQFFAAPGASYEWFHVFAAQSTNEHVAVVAGMNSPGGPTIFWPRISASSGEPGASVSLGSDWPVFVARSGSGLHLVGTRSSAQAPLYGHIVQTDGTGPAQTTLLACPVTDSGYGAVAAAVAYQDGWLVAVPNAVAAPDSGCGPPDSGAVYGSGIEVLRVTPSGSVASVMGVGASQVLAMLATPHTRGMYLIWQEWASNAAHPIYWRRVDVPALAVVGTGEDDDYPEGFSAATLGSRLAVTLGDKEATNPKLAVFDASLNVVAETALESSNGSALVGSPDGTSLVIGREAVKPARIQLARFDCVPPE